jgi:osmotically inducible protein OsmC
LPESGSRRVTLSPDTAIDAEVDLRFGPSGYSLAARLNISIPGVDRETAMALVKAGEETCPYSKAIRGNVDVEINLL